MKIQNLQMAVGRSQLGLTFSLKEKMKDKSSLRVGEVLLKWGIITQEQLTNALESQKVSQKRLGDILIDDGIINEQQIVEVLAQEYRLPVLNIDKVVLNPKLLKMFSYQMLKKYNVTPIKMEEGYLLIATNDPLNLYALQELRNVSGYRIKPVMATSEGIRGFVEKHFGHLTSVQGTPLL